ncbi:VanZ family protein [Thermolongibacillus altinsuensis]
MNSTNKRMWWGLVFLWCGLIYYFTESPLFTGEQTANVIKAIFHYFGIETSRPVSDGFFSWNYIVRKFAHLSVFGTLAFFAWKAIYPHRFAWVGAWLFALAYAMFDEWHQSFQPGRTALFSDVVIDAAGAFLVLLFVWMRERAKRIT